MMAHMAPKNTGTSQSDVIAFLESPASYPGRPESVDRIETHGALVFLAGARVYKIKRAVRLPYFDFSTLEKRRAVCKREVEINRATAPSLYRGVVAITRQANGALALGGDGEPVEYAVEMTRFDQDLLLDKMAERGALDIATMAPLADHIADYHANAPVHRKGGTEALAKVVAQVAAAIAGAGDTLGEPARGCAHDLARRFGTNRARLEEREGNGFVRRCHGDLHLRNIVLLDGDPTLFDAIEFDEAIATIDVLYDLAFLLMDLWHRDHRRHANAVFNRYLWRADAKPDIAALGLMPLFLALRAGVRTMVALDRMGQLEGNPRAAQQEQARSYFEMVEKFLRPQPPRLVAVGGLSGTGKSTLAAALAPCIGAAPGALHLRSDVERKLLFGRAPEERLGEEAYTAQATERVYAILAEKAGLALAAGHSVVLDAVHARRDERDAARAVAGKAGAAFDGVWLSASRDELIRRVGARRGDASDADAGIVRRQLDYELGEMTWNRLDAGGAPEDVAAAALQLLARDGSPR